MECRLVPTLDAKGAVIVMAVNASLQCEPTTSIMFSRFGWWRSLVAHLTGGQGVAGSNPVHPTRQTREPARLPFSLCDTLTPGSRGTGACGEADAGRLWRAASGGRASFCLPLDRRFKSCPSEAGLCRPVLAKNEPPAHSPGARTPPRQTREPTRLPFSFELVENRLRSLRNFLRILPNSLANHARGAYKLKFADTSAY